MTRPRPAPGDNRPENRTEGFRALPFGVKQMLADPSRSGPFGQGDRAGRVLVLGKSAVARQLASALEVDGVTTVIAASGREALARLPRFSPDILVINRHPAGDSAGREVADRMFTRRGRRPEVVVIGKRAAHRVVEAGDTDPQPDAASQHLPVNVGVAELAGHLRSKLDQAGSMKPPRRRAISPQRLADAAHRELQPPDSARRPGIMAAVTVAELDQLKTLLGPRAEQALARAMEELLAIDAYDLEQHSTSSGSGFFVVMPETDLAAGQERLQQLSRRMASTIIDVAGEHIRVTPVIGYTTFAGADNVQQLQDQAAAALEDARRHLDLLPVRYSPAMISAPPAQAPARDRLLELAERLRSPFQIIFTFALLLSLPFIVYVVTWDLGFDLTRVTYPAVAAALGITAVVLWIESFQAVGSVNLPEAIPKVHPSASAIIAAYLPNEAATIVDTVENLLKQDYPGNLQVILAYNTPTALPVEDTLAGMAAADPRLLLLKVPTSTSKAQNVNAALAHVRGEFVGIFDADHHPAPGSFERAWRWLSQGHDIVQGHCVVRNGAASWVARLIAVEFETIYAVSHPGRARLHGFGIFGGSNGYWRTESLRRIRMQGKMLTEDIDSSMRSLLDGFSIVSDPGLLSTELAPTTVRSLWHQRMRWAQGWTQTARRHLGPALGSNQLTARQKVGATFLLGWTQAVPWITVQVIPILAFTVWRDGGFGGFDLLIPLFVLLTLFTFSVGLAQTLFAYLLGDSEVRRHRWWFALFALHGMLWFGEFKNIISRVAQLKELSGEHQWRVTPRAAPTNGDLVEPANSKELQDTLAR